MDSSHQVFDVLFWDFCPCANWYAPRKVVRKKPSYQQLTRQCVYRLLQLGSLACCNRIPSPSPSRIVVIRRAMKVCVRQSSTSEANRIGHWRTDQRLVLSGRSSGEFNDRTEQYCLSQRRSVSSEVVACKFARWINSDCCGSDCWVTERLTRSSRQVCRRLDSSSGHAFSCRRRHRESPISSDLGRVLLADYYTLTLPKRIIGFSRRAIESTIPAIETWHITEQHVIRQAPAGAPHATEVEDCQNHFTHADGQRPATVAQLSYPKFDQTPLAVRPSTYRKPPTRYSLADQLVLCTGSYSITHQCRLRMALRP